MGVCNQKWGEGDGELSYTQKVSGSVTGISNLKYAVQTSVGLRLCRDVSSQNKQSGETNDLTHYKVASYVMYPYLKNANRIYK